MSNSAKDSPIKDAAATRKKIFRHRMAQAKFTAFSISRPHTLRRYAQ